MLKWLARSTYYKLNVHTFCAPSHIFEGYFHIKHLTKNVNYDKMRLDETMGGS